MGEATGEGGTAPPRRRRGREAAVTVACLGVWIVLFIAIAATVGKVAEANALPTVGMTGLFLGAWLMAEYLVNGRGMVWPGAMLGLIGPISLGYGAPMATAATRALETNEHFTIICAVSALGMLLFLFRFRLAALVSPIVTFTVVALFLAVRGTSEESLRQVEGFSPRGILAALVDEPLHMAVFGALAVAAMAFARWLDLKGQEFGMASAKPLHIIGAGVTALVAGRLAAGLAWPLDLAALLALFALAMAWGLRLDRIAVMLTGFFALARPLGLTLLQLTGGTLDVRDWAFAHMAVLGVGLMLWPVLRKRTVAAGYTKKPRHITWNWPDRVIYPYRPPPGHR